MNEYTSKTKYKRVTFVENEVSTALTSAVEWLKETTKVKAGKSYIDRPNSFYYSSMNVYYDGEYYIIDVFYYEAK